METMTVKQRLLECITLPLIGRGHRGRLIRHAMSDAVSEIDRLEAALQPFATVAQAYEAADAKHLEHCRDERGKDYTVPPTPDYHQIQISLGDCRKARSVLGRE